MNKIFARHEIDQFNEVRTVDPDDDCQEVEVGPNLIICRTVEDVDFLIEPDSYKADKAKWVIA